MGNLVNKRKKSKQKPDQEEKGLPASSAPEMENDALVNETPREATRNQGQMSTTDDTDQAEASAGCVPADIPNGQVKPSGGSREADKRDTEDRNKNTQKHDKDKKPKDVGIDVDQKHTQLITLGSGSETKPPQPSPPKNKGTWKWDSDHVKLPCSPGSVWLDRKNTKKRRWASIQDALECKMGSFKVLKHVIMWNNKAYLDKWDLSGLETYTRGLSSQRRNDFFLTILPGIADLALDLPNACTQDIPLLKKDKRHKITLSQYQIACLLANAFFCTFPHRNARGSDKECSSFPTINFSVLFMTDTRMVKPEKLKCIVHYFEKVTQKVMQKKGPVGAVSFQRKVLRECPDWGESKKRLSTLNVTHQGGIDEEGKDMLQVDFANEYVGGGVIGSGSVQEEIMFLTCPEMLVSRLFTEKLGPKETLLMTGCEKYSKHTGYSYGFKYDGGYEDKRKRDKQGRLQSEVVCMDALHFQKPYTDIQYDEINVLRELNKAYCGFAKVSDSVLDNGEVATGNWGCGAFGGDPKLKALIQLMAASEAERDIWYYTFRDHQLEGDLRKCFDDLKKEGVCVGELFNSVVRYKPYLDYYNQGILQFVIQDIETQRDESNKRAANQNSAEPDTNEPIPDYEDKVDAQEDSSMPRTGDAEAKSNVSTDNGDSHKDKEKVDDDKKNEKKEEIKDAHENSSSPSTGHEQEKSNIFTEKGDSHKDEPAPDYEDKVEAHKKPPLLSDGHAETKSNIFTENCDSHKDKEEVDGDKKNDQKDEIKDALENSSLPSTCHEEKKSNISTEKGDSHQDKEKVDDDKKNDQNDEKIATPENTPCIGSGSSHGYDDTAVETHI